MAPSAMNIALATIFAAFFGVMVSFGSLLVYTFGTFLKPLSGEFGWSRQAISTAFGCAAITVAICSPALGHLLAESFAQKAGIKLQQIMTKGASQGMMDLVAGTVNVGTMTWTSALSQIRAGKVIPVAVTASRFG